MMYDVIADAAQECASDFTHTSGTSNDQLTSFFLSNFAYYLPWVPTNGLDFSANLS